MLSGPYLFFTGAGEVVPLSSHGLWSWTLISAGISHNLSCAGCAVAPICVPLSQPSVRPLQTVITLPQPTPIPWRVKRGHQGLLTLDPLCSHTCALLWFFMDLCKAAASQRAIREVGHSLLFAQSLNINGFRLIPISSNLYGGLALQE